MAWAHNYSSLQLTCHVFTLFGSAEGLRFLRPACLSVCHFGMASSWLEHFNEMHGATFSRGYAMMLLPTVVRQVLPVDDCWVRSYRTILVASAEPLRDLSALVEPEA